MAAIVSAAFVMLYPRHVSNAVFTPWLVIAGIFLSGRCLMVALSAIVMSYSIAAISTWGMNARQWSVLTVIVLIVLIVAPLTRSRAENVSLSLGSTMLGELRQRLDKQASIPVLPEGYHVESHVMPARAGHFSGDFVVAARRDDTLDIALTDVSGHGPSAATRALLLSGALSGLLGECGPEQFLPAANRYVVRQGWRDGFASSVHVSLNLADGRYCLGSAGHPTAAHFRAATGEWEMIAGTYGLLLGVFEQEESDYRRACGQLAPGDAIILYTDGVVEGPRGDLVAGTHQMLASAQTTMLSEDIFGAAERICARSAQLGGDDDRSAVVIWRTGVPAAKFVDPAKPADVAANA